MGWFDEDDDDDEEEENNHDNAGSKEGKEVPKSTVHAHDTGGNNVEHEEDPLDAYMKSLDTTARSIHPRAERLDVQNEEEATEHWQETKRPQSHHDDDDEAFASVAHQALANTFHPASSSTVKEYNDEDHDEDKSKPLTLPNVKHDQMQYEPFHKAFSTPHDTTRGHEWRKLNDVTCTPGQFDPILQFHELRSVLGDTLLQTIVAKGYNTPTAVQSQTLAVALAGRDALVTASTGSGKTLAYVWPMVVHVCDQRPLEPGETGPIGIVLVPTRELALQVHKYVKTMLSALGGKSVAVTGGSSNYQLVQELNKGGCEVVVATPGRFIDVLTVKKKGGMSLKRVTFVVLDEADKMLDMGFEAQVTQILNNVRPDRQSLLLSATMGRKVERLAQQWLTQPVRISVGRTGESSEHVQQHVMVVPSYIAKKEWMMQMLPILADVGRTLVFVATRVDCEELAIAVRERSPGLVVETLHGDKHQVDRNAALRAFSKGQLGALIATDVAARGLDVDNVSTVVNFDPAKNLDSHVHRIGRAGRLSKDEHKKGVAYTLLTPKNADFAQILVNAFEREGREVTTELKALAYQSRKAGNVTGRTKWNKSGLGFHDDDPSSDVSKSLPPKSSTSTDNPSYYGPPEVTETPDPSQPRVKRSRWG